MSAITAVSTSYDAIAETATITFGLVGGVSFIYTHATERITAPSRTDTFVLEFAEAERLQRLLAEWIARVISQFKPSIGLSEANVDLRIKKNPAGFGCSLKFGSQNTDIELDGSTGIQFNPRDAMNLTIGDFINWLWMHMMFRVMARASTLPQLGPLPW